MKTLSIIFLFLLLSVGNATDVLRKMYSRNHGHWHKTFHFIQDTERYRNDSLVAKETWYEALLYPDKFRIDFGNPSEGNAYICNKDSAWIFKKGKMVRRTDHVNEFVFLLGGMYYYPFDTVLAEFRRRGYDLGRYHNSTWKGKSVYVIGAAKDGEKANQLWIDKEKLVIVRFINYEDSLEEEGLIEGHIKLKDGWVETKAAFYHNGKLVQLEKYHDCVVNDPLDPRIFDPTQFGQYHWYKK